MTRPRVILGSALSLPLIVAGLWCWRFAPAIAGRLDVSNSDIFTSAIRSAGVASIAAGEFVAVALIIGSLYQPAALDRSLKWIAGLAFTAAGAGAAAFAIAGR